MLKRPSLNYFVLFKTPDHLDVHVKVVPDGVHNLGEGGAQLLPASLVISDQVRVAMPGLPQLLLGHSASLDINQSEASILVT